MTLLIWDLILVPIGWAWVWKQYTRLSITRWKLYNEAWICWHSFGRAMPSYCFFISLIHPFGLFSLMEFLIAEGGEAAIPMLAVCSCNSVVDIIFHQHSKARGTFQIKPPISHANNDNWKRKCHWFYTVSLADWLFNRHAHTHTHKKKKKNPHSPSYFCSKFEREFNAELQSLGPILSNSSQAEPYLTHLAQWILGDGHDQ